MPAPMNTGSVFTKSDPKDKKPTGMNPGSKIPRQILYAIILACVLTFLFKLSYSIQKWYFNPHRQATVALEEQEEQAHALAGSIPLLCWGPKHHGYQYFWLELTETESPPIYLASDNGQSMKYASGDENPEPILATIRYNCTDKAFPITLELFDPEEENPYRYKPNCQVDTVQFGAQNSKQHGRRIVGVRHRPGVRLLKNWPMEAIHEMRLYDGSN